MIFNSHLKNEGPVGFSYRACIHPTDGHGVTIMSSIKSKYTKLSCDN